MDSAGRGCAVRQSVLVCGPPHGAKCLLGGDRLQPLEQFVLFKAHVGIEDRLERSKRRRDTLFPADRALQAGDERADLVMGKPHSADELGKGRGLHGERQEELFLFDKMGVEIGFVEGEELGAKAEPFRVRGPSRLRFPDGLASDEDLEMVPG